jgi:hypothetical protein
MPKRRKEARQPRAAMMTLASEGTTNVPEPTPATTSPAIKPLLARYHRVTWRGPGDAATHPCPNEEAEREEKSGSAVGMGEKKVAEAEENAGGADDGRGADPVGQPSRGAARAPPRKKQREYAPRRDVLVEPGSARRGLRKTPNE